MFQILDKVSHLRRKGERDRSTDNRGREKGGREEGRREEGGGRENGDTPPNGEDTDCPRPRLSVESSEDTHIIYSFYLDEVSVTPFHFLFRREPMNLIMYSVPNPPRPSLHAAFFLSPSSCP